MVPLGVGITEPVLGTGARMDMPAFVDSLAAVDEESISAVVVALYRPKKNKEKRLRKADQSRQNSLIKWAARGAHLS